MTRTQAHLPPEGLASLSWRRSPVLSLQALLIDVLGGGGHSPPDLLRHLRSQIGRTDRETLAPLADGMSRVTFPLVMVPDVSNGKNWVEETTSLIGDADPDALVNALERPLIPLSSSWRTVADDPGRWLKDTALVMRRLGRTVDVVWRRAQLRLDIEQARFEMAHEAAAQVDFVNGLSPTARLSSTQLTLASDQAFQYDVPGHVVVTPLIAGPGAHLLVVRPGEVCLGYPATAAMTGPEPRGDLAPLMALLGEPRAAVLLNLTRATTLGSLADQLNWPISTVSHHLLTLERTGLSWSLRLGKQRWIARTEAGHRLVDVLS